MKILSPEQYKRILDTEISACHFTREEYLLSCAFSLEEEIEKRNCDNITIVCGSCEKGEIGIVLANVLSRKGNDVTLVIVNYSEHRPVEKEIKLLSTLREIRENLLKTNLIVDCLLQDTLEKEKDYHCRQVIRWTNESEAYKVSPFIPSGIDPENGEIYNEAVNANQTVVFQYPVVGLFLYPGSTCRGELTYRSSIFSIDAIHAAEYSAITFTDNEICKMVHSLYSKEKNRLKRVLLYSNEQNANLLCNEIKIIGEIGKCATTVLTNSEMVCSGLSSTFNDRLTVEKIKQSSDINNRSFGLYDIVAYDQQKEDADYILNNILRTNKPLIINMTSANRFEDILNRAEKEALTMMIIHNDDLPCEINRKAPFKTLQRITQYQKNIALLIIGENTYLTYQGLIYIIYPYCFDGPSSLHFATILSLLIKENSLQSIITAAYIVSLSNGLFSANPLYYFPKVRDVFSMVMEIMETMVKKPANEDVLK